MAVWAETSENGTEWGRWSRDTADGNEEPRTGEELRKILRGYGRTIASAISTTAHDTRWVRVIARCNTTERNLGMDVRAFDWVTRGYVESPPRSWVICDNPRECDQWRVSLLTKRLGSWGATGNRRKHGKASPTWIVNRNAALGGIAALVIFGVGAAAYIARDLERVPAVAAPHTTHTPAPSPTRTEVIKVVRVEIPNGGTVDVPVGGSEAETRKAITQVVNQTLDAKRKNKGDGALPSPSDSASGKPTATPSPTAEDAPEPSATPTPERTTGPTHNVMPVNALLSTVLPLPVDHPETRTLAAPTADLRLFSTQLAAMGTVTEEKTVQQERTTALAAKVSIKGAVEPVTVAAAITTPLFSATSKVEVATAKTEDEIPAKKQEEAPRLDTDETVTRVGVTAVMDAVDAD